MLFCDVTGSTALGETVDPERLRALLARYFERMKGIVESHGGTVEKFIGDAVMAVFGVPLSHEDDALRAVRAAVEMRDALPQLGLQARIGVNTGEVVTGTEERLATGDAVNVAARLEQAARSGEVLLGDATLALVREAVDVEALEPLELKGKGEPVPRLPARLRPRGAGARARDPFRRQSRRARNAAASLGACLRRATLRARDRGWRCRRRQVALGGRVSCFGRGPESRRPLPSLWQGDHLLARDRGDQAAGRASFGSCRSRLDPLASAGDRRGDLGRGNRLGVP